MINRLAAGTGAVAAALLLTACGTSAHHASRPSAAQCASAEATIRQVSLVTSHFTSVKTSRDLAAAGRKLGQLGREIAAATATARGSKSGTFLGSAVMIAVKMPRLPPSLAREMRRVEADDHAFWTAWAANSRSKADPQAVGAAAQKTMRDIHAITATCAKQSP